MKSSVSHSNIEANMLIDNMLQGYAFHKIITNKKNEAIDYLFLEVNKQFESLPD